MDLDEAISQQVELGEKDALAVAEKILSLYGKDWLANELLAHAEDIIVTRVHHLLDAQRRNAIVSIRSNRGLQKAELGLKTIYVPNLLGNGVGARKPLNECTAEDFDAAAGYRESIARSVLNHAGWLREVSARMRSQGAGTFGEYTGEVPPFNELEAA